mmetsp:Transcript_9017/g.19263  ORF Transcript_9017/g.19263 Transcript_9017/m.19263 type:complete len:208 (-) Transcript_9017:716-1339(-)
MRLRRPPSRSPSPELAVVVPLGNIARSIFMMECLQPSKHDVEIQCIVGDDGNLFVVVHVGIFARLRFSHSFLLRLGFRSSFAFKARRTLAYGSVISFVICIGLLFIFIFITVVNPKIGICSILVYIIIDVIIGIIQNMFILLIFLLIVIIYPFRSWYKLFLFLFPLRCQYTLYLPLPLLMSGTLPFVEFTPFLQMPHVRMKYIDLVL